MALTTTTTYKQKSKRGTIICNKWTIKLIVLLFNSILFSALFLAFRSFQNVKTLQTVQKQQHGGQLLLKDGSSEQQEQLNLVTIKGKKDTNTTMARNNDITIAYAVTVTGCGDDPITEGAAVLKHSIHRVSNSIGGIGRYNYTMFVFYHPDSEQCVLPLQQLGYKLLKRPTPIAVDEIQGEFLRTRIISNGCCGEKELIKLEAYTLIDYPIVVHLDLDVLILQPLDNLFDWMLTGTITEQIRQQTVQFPDRPSTIGTGQSINAFYTIDYNMANPHRQYQPVQGGFLIVRPNLTVYEHYKEIIKLGDYRENGGGGWGGVVGPFYGSMTFQGLIPYYYNYIQNNTDSIELNHCIYNNMANNPRTGPTRNDIVSGECRTGQDTCEDCRSRPISDVITTHYTLCQKPWTCYSHNEDRIQSRLCRQLTEAWYKTRSDMEQSWNRSGYGPYKNNSDPIFYGYCKHHPKNYYTVQQPYGQ